MRNIVYKSKGITLIALIITIIVVIILSSIVYFQTNNALNSMSEAKFKSELRGLMDRLKIYHENANLESFSYKSNKLEWNGISERATNTGKVENGTDEDTAEYILGKIPAYFQGKVKINDGKLELLVENISEDEELWAEDLGIVIASLDGLEKYTVTFDANGGSLSQNTRRLFEGEKVGQLPTPTRTDYSFLGWYTDATNGDKISSETRISGEVTYYAHWTDMPVEMDGVYYASIKLALNQVKDATPKTITLLRNIVLTEAIDVKVGRNITFNLQNYTISTSGDRNILINYGNTIINNGELNTTGTPRSN